MAKNVLGGDLQPCSIKPLTSFLRTKSAAIPGLVILGFTCCAADDRRSSSNSPSTRAMIWSPASEYDFPGLKTG